jgi:ATP diphosphatase
MAKEQGTFSIDDVLDRLSRKLVDRHPHVFGDAKADTSADVKAQLGGIESRRTKKAVERGRGLGRRRWGREGFAIDSSRHFFVHAVVARSPQAQFARGAGWVRLA